MTREYFNEKAAIWDENVAEKDADKLEQMVKRLNVEPGSIVLDVGTGTGVFLPFILQAAGKRVKIIALDFAEEMLKRALVKDYNGNIYYIQADIAHIPLPDVPVDIVVCYSSFPHFQDKPGILTEIRRVMRSGGRLTICHTSNRAEINEIHRQIPVVENDLLPEESEMHTLLSGAGFTDVMIADEDEGLSEWEDLLVVDRNKNWIPVMERMMNEAPTFFAVGAGHLAGKNGVIRLLRKSGYSVTAVLVL